MTDELAARIYVNDNNPEGEMGAYRNWQVEAAKAAILELIKGWDGYEKHTSQICEALEAAAADLGDSGTAREVPALADTADGSPF